MPKKPRKDVILNNNKVLKFLTKYEKINNKKPTQKEISEYTGLSQKAVSNILKRLNN